MVSLYSVSESGTDRNAVLSDLAKTLGRCDIEPAFIFAFYGCEHDGDAIRATLAARFPGIPYLGGTSCGGFMRETGMQDANSVGLLLIEDADGDYGVAAGPLGDDAVGSSERLLREALTNAECPGQLPELVWVFQTPGREEDVIEGLRNVLGDACPIIGGSAADNTVEGNWQQIGPSGVYSDGLAIAVLFPSGGIGFAFQGGYEPIGPSGVVTRVHYSATGPSGIVTRSSGREILEIDGRPAAEIYNEWTGNRLSGKIGTSSTILTDTTMCPIAVDAGAIEGISHYLLIHPEAVTPAGGLKIFASLEEGVRVHSMSGDRDRLVERAGRVAREAAALLPGGPESLAGGLVVYCAGCMLAVGDEMPSVAAGVADSFEGKPFLGCFTFGEQGLLVDRNVHGNLMISAIAFGQ